MVTFVVGLFSTLMYTVHLGGLWVILNMIDIPD